MTDKEFETDFPVAAAAERNNGRRVDGITLLIMIRDGEIEDGTKILIFNDRDEESPIICIKGKLKWRDLPERFVQYNTFIDNEFVIIKNKNEKVEKLETQSEYGSGASDYDIIEKINELVVIINELKGSKNV